MPRATDLFGPIFRGEGAMRLDDVTLDPRYGKSAPYHGMPEGHLPVRSFLAVPVISRSRQVLGGLFFGHSEVGVFRSRHEEIAIGIAAQAAIALDNARLFEQARAQARELADANERKNDFLALLAHELRNPLGAIGNALALAEAADGRSDVISEAFGIVRRQSSYITRLVDDLFDVSRIGRGMVELEREKLELRQVVEHAIESIMPQLETRRQRLELEMPAEAVPVKGDPVRLGQVVTNLLSNASKHSPEDCRIWLEVERKKRWVQLTVRDEGMGIEPDFLPRVFDLFARGGRDNGRSSPPGLGIGLTLVRQLVELHEGEIEARSKGPGQGSEFRVRLPLTPEGTQATRPEAVTVSEVEPAEPAKPAGLRVLLVDDHREAVTALQALLELWGHKVRVAFDGPSALELARQYPPELVLLDIGLPEMDGWEVASRLRQRPETAAATLIALTGFGQETDRARSREAGFDHHLVKPVNPQALKNYLIEWTSEPSEPS